MVFENVYENLGKCGDTTQVWISEMKMFSKGDVGKGGNGGSEFKEKSTACKFSPNQLNCATTLP